MQLDIKSIRPFIGAKNFDVARRFYSELGFEETTLGPKMSVFEKGAFGFYLQDAYVEAWVENTMVFMEVADVQQFWNALLDLNLPAKYVGVRIVPVKKLDWGSECFVHDPSGILWHIGEFN